MNVSITDALRVALQERLERTAPRPDVVWTEILAIIERGRSRPDLDTRTDEEIVGYDEHGAPA